MKSGPIAGLKAYDLRGRVPSELNEDVPTVLDAHTPTSCSPAG